ncbi:acyl-CoA desaturase [Chryseolinea sp. T2]|uniref:fatty acid desaturase family protein n=1 Tax=Chryseolinea sp. T2 TaxID=3129255 RepID=UPI003076C2EB
MLKYKFDNSHQQLFPPLKKKVDEYFSGVRHPAGNQKLYVKASLQVGMAISLYVLLVFFTPPAWISVGLCVVLGILLSLIGFNVMHEGGHQSFSRHAWLNKLSSYFLNILGGNQYYWKIKHNQNHHTYTNIEGMDSDIDVKPLMRLHEGQPHRWYHRFQHIYWVFLYGISYLVWVFYEDFQKYVSGKINSNSEAKKMAPREHVIFWFTKLMYIFCYIVVPIIFVGWASWLVGFLIVTFVCGLAISIVFQLAHVVGGTSFHSAEGGTSDCEWAVHQLASTSNFGTSSRLLHWFLGGLNFQIEHHLFPRVSHIHYPAISVFVREACKKAGIAYHEHRTMMGAIVSHVMLLHKLGRG